MDANLDDVVRDLLAELEALRELERRRLALDPGSEAYERVTADLDQKNAELMERFRRRSRQDGGAG